jgi:hypothetical protein
MFGVPGVTAIETTVFAVTVSVTLALMPLSEAVTVMVPGASEVSNPVDEIVARPVLLVVQVTVAVTFAVELSLYVAVAVSCRLRPSVTLVVPGAMAID